MPAALIMAGGKSSRMRATLGPSHKALVEVLGVPMIERNLTALFVQGFTEVDIAASVGENALHEWVETRGRALAREADARVGLLIENEPLGTIGAAGLIPDVDDLLIINVDNLSAIDLQDLLREHRRGASAMTVAVHEEAFTIPFGAVRLEDDRIVEYAEKPERRILISSGTYVLGSAARSSIEPRRPTNIPELVSTLRLRRLRVAAYRHDQPWIDVNDAQAVGRAEALVSQNAARFERNRPTR